MYLDCKIYGPYKRKDNRSHVIIIYNNGERRTVSYPRYLVEQSIGRMLSPTEDVHHLDGDILNNNLKNLQIVEHIKHCSDHSKKLPESVDMQCVHCGKIFYLSRRQIRHLRVNANRGKIGPFCSQYCSGKYNTSTQIGMSV